MLRYWGIFYGNNSNSCRRARRRVRMFGGHFLFMLAIHLFMSEGRFIYFLVHWLKYLRNTPCFQLLLWLCTSCVMLAGSVTMILKTVEKRSMQFRGQLQLLQDYIKEISKGRKNLPKVTWSHSTHFMLAMLCILCMCIVSCSVTCL